MLAIWVVILVIVFLYIRNNKKNKHVYECAKKFPGPRAYPIVGNSLDFATNSAGKCTSHIYRKKQELIVNYLSRYF